MFFDFCHWNLIGVTTQQYLSDFWKREGFEGRAQQNVMKEGVRGFLVKRED